MNAPEPAPSSRRHPALALCAALLAGCGGSGGSDPAPGPTDLVLSGGCGDYGMVGPSGQHPLWFGGLHPAAEAGQPQSCNIMIRNAGTEASRDTRYAMVLGSGLSLLGVGCDASGGAVCPQNPGLEAGIASLPGGATLVIGFRFSTPPGANTTLEAGVQIHASNDTNAANDATRLSFEVHSTDLSLAATAPATATAGSEFVIEAVLSNRGPGAFVVEGAALDLPAGTSLLSSDAFAPDGSPVPKNYINYREGFDIPVGQFVRQRFHVAVAAGTAGPMTFRARVPAIADPTPLDNVAEFGVQAITP